MGIEQRDRQGLWNGYGTTLTRAFEFALTPIVFGLLGAGLDHLVGTWPLFMILFGLFAVVGLAVRSYYAYVAEMAEHEKQLPGRARQTS